MVLRARVVVGDGLEVLKVRVVAGLLGGDAAGRVVDEHHLEEVEAGVVEVAAQRGGLVASPLGEGRLEVGIAANARPDVFRGCAQEAEGEWLAALG